MDVAIKCLALLLVAAFANLAAAQTPDPTLLDEFPSGDSAGWGLMTASLTTKAAADVLARPPSPEVVRILVNARRVDDAFRTAARVIDMQPEAIAATLRVFADDAYRALAIDDINARDHQTALDRLVAEARARLPELPLEERAAAAFAMLPLAPRAPSDPPDIYQQRRARLIEEYPGTQAAILAEIASVTSLRDRSEQLRKLDSFIRTHDGTVPGAEALYLKGWQLHHQGAIRGFDRGDDDPADDFLEVLRIVDALESGRFPPCEWVTRAPSLIIEFFTFEPVYRNGSIDRMLAGYESFVTTHFPGRERITAESGIGYVVTGKMADLYALQGRREQGIEQLFDRLEQGRDARAAKYLRAIFYVSEIDQRHDDPPTGPHRAELQQKAVNQLRAIAADGGDRYARLATATLATLYYVEHDYGNAKSVYDAYLLAYRSSAFAWIAAIRRGQCEAMRGDLTAAVAAYDNAATLSDLPAVSVVADALKGRTLESLGRLREASDAYRRAIEHWDSGAGQRYDLTIFQTATPTAQGVPEWMTAVEKAALRTRLARVDSALSRPDGAVLARARALLDAGDRRGARKVLEPLVAKKPRSTARGDATYVLHRIELADALETGDAKMLGRLASAPFDAAVAAATIAIASRAWLDGDSDRARTRMAVAMRAWQRASEMQRSDPRSDLERDVAALRSDMFRPQGGGPFGPSRFGGFAESDGRRPFILVESEIVVALANGEIDRMVLHQSFAHAQSVVFAGADELRLLKDVMVAISSTATRRRTGVMDLFNQPNDTAIHVAELWKEFFFVEPWHWGGWVFETYPIVTKISFADEARTRASVEVTTGYGGVTAEYEKINGVWMFKAITRAWET